MKRTVYHREQNTPQAIIHRPRKHTDDKGALFSPSPRKSAQICGFLPRRFRCDGECPPPGWF